MNKAVLKKIGLVFLALFIMFSSNLLIGFIITEVGVHKVRSLKWVSLLLASFSTYLGCLVLRKKDWRLSLISFLNLLFLYIIGLLANEMIIWLIIVISSSILLAQPRKALSLKLPALVGSLGITLYFLFTQPLIIELDGFGSTADGDLVNAKLLWGDLNASKKTIPDEVFEDIDGKSYTLNDFIEKNIFVTFWATWCGPCIAEKPWLDSLKQSYAQREDILFIDIAIGQNEDEWNDFIKENNPDGIQLISASQGTTSTNFGFDGIPYDVLVNKDGQFKKASRPRFFDAKNILRNDSTITKFINSPIKIYMMK